MFVNLTRNDMRKELSCKFKKTDEIKNFKQMGSGGDVDVIKFLHCDKAGIQGD